MSWMNDKELRKEFRYRANSSLGKKLSELTPCDTRLLLESMFNDFSTSNKSERDAWAVKFKKVFGTEIKKAKTCDDKSYEKKR